MQPPRLVPLGLVALGTQPWTFGAQERTTLVAKVTLSSGPDGLAIAPPDPIRVRDVHWGDDPARSLQDCTDLAPVLPRAEVLLVGSAWVPRGGRVLARLGLARGAQILLDKQAWVVGAPGSGPAERVALTWENALGGPSTTNPVGGPNPRVTSPSSPASPCGFGPIPRYWPARAALLRAEDRKGVRGSVVEIAEGMNWAFFQAAPEDQRLAQFFSGDEILVLDHVHPTVPRVELRLPRVRAFTRILRGTELGEPAAMRADLLRVDADRGVVSLTFRADLPVDAGRFVVACGVETADAPIAWPTAEACARDASNTRIARPKTAAIRMADLGLDTLPFAGGRAGARGEETPPSRAVIPGAPWAGSPPSTPAPSADPLMSTLSLGAPAPRPEAPPAAVRASPAPAPAQPSFAKPVAAPTRAQASAAWLALPPPPGVEAFELGPIHDPFRKAAPPPSPSGELELGRRLLEALTSRAAALYGRSEARSDR